MKHLDKFKLFEAKKAAVAFDPTNEKIRSYLNNNKNLEIINRK